MSDLTKLAAFSAVMVCAGVEGILVGKKFLYSRVRCPKNMKVTAEM